MFPPDDPEKPGEEVIEVGAPLDTEDEVTVVYVMAIWTKDGENKLYQIVHKTP